MQRSGVVFAVTSMLCIQVGLALSVGLMDRVSPSGMGWLRVAWSALVLLVLVRPGRRDVTPTTVALGVVTAGLLLTFMGAVARLPLGTATSLEFLGPLGVAVAHGRGRGRLAWPAVAALGVVLLTEPWQGFPNLVGVLLALTAAGFWAAYILLTERAGQEGVGLRPLAVSFPVAALVGTGYLLVAEPVTLVSLDAPTLLFGAGLAVVMTVIPFILELAALRELPTSTFGVLMALEPAFACLVGAGLLGQIPGTGMLAGVLLVVAAGIGVARPTVAGPAPARGELEPVPL